MQKTNHQVETKVVPSGNEFEIFVGDQLAFHVLRVGSREHHLIEIYDRHRGTTVVLSEDVARHLAGAIAMICASADGE